ncbi:MAG TPA: SDR family oxidoreductase [Gaiellaceae bacterium]|nr:SDR family oxidoreductase [Gaiellaceae bacterium]
MTRSALVTGASTGIGLAIAERLVADGWALGFATHERDEDAAREFERLSTLGRVQWVSGDLSDADVPARLVSETVEALGGLDALVNNAGVTLAKPVLELTADDFDSIFSIDVRAAFLLSQQAARRMADGGAIVNVTSVHEHVPRVGFALYASAKAALGMLTKSLALELAPSIRVNAVAPGVTATERNEEAESLGADTPLRRAGTPAEVAAVVAFLLSDEAAYLTGESVVVDGGALQNVFRPAV